VKAAVGLGCSLGDRRRTLESAVRKLTAHPSIRLVRCSRGYRTPPMRGGTARGWFLNAVVVVDTELEPLELLEVCRGLERRAGRRRARWWGDRTLDLDLLLLGGRMVHTAELQLPHPAIGARPFVRTPLVEVWPDAVDPRTGTLYRELPAAAGPRAVPVMAFAFGPRCL
jgi:2-amino-4-hydroxy-6-hydroxymethyldihydropteridine diphosphokinase